MRKPILNILFISYDGMTDPLGQSQVIPYLKGLSKHGYKIFLLSCEKKEAYALNKNSISSILKEASIHWHPLSYTKNPPVLSTLIDVMKLKNAAASIHQTHKIDMVHTRPGIPALVGMWMKKKYNIKFLNDIREFYADSRVDGGIWNRKNALYNSIYQYFKKKEDEQVRISDGIVCLTHAARAIIQQWTSYNHSVPVAVIPCSVDLQLFDEASLDQQQREALKQKYGIQPTDMVVTYLGSIGGWYLTAEMMQFCKQLLNYYSNAKFLFISPHLHQHIITTAAQYGIPANKIIAVKGNRPQIPLLLSLSNYSIFFIKPCYSKLSSSPTKHGELMAMGIPVISNSGVGDVKEIITKYNAGFVIDDFTPASFKKVIDQIEKVSFKKEEIRAGAFDFYSLDQAIKSYIALYKKILFP
jgi:glycosyltransferase involved in cell wall biosynthesis